ncbi:MAG TPA: acyl-CoA dehydrogenase family protein [Ramlibacter sp.]|nr:acyl-CoA dehydrogenase family protein [Ramlibacter sp.]
MDTLLGDDERMVAEQARVFLASACPTSLVRACEAQGKYSPQLWQAIVDLGWLETCLPEHQGGLGLPLHYLTLLFEEAGRHLAPVPLISTVVSTLILAEHGGARHDSCLARVRAGELLFSMALQEHGGAWSPEAIQMVGRLEGDSVVLDGAKMFVDNFGISDRCLVAFRMQGDEGGLTLAVVDTKAANLTHQELTPTAKDSQALVHFDGVRVSLGAVVGEIGKAEAAIRKAMDLAVLLGTAQMTGASRRAIEMAVEYANPRHAFGQPIGSFQAIQHQCADMLIGVDGAELLNREASWKLGQGLDAGVEVSQAKAFANDKCVMACRSAQQIHGGMGFMMDCDIQLFYRRVVSGSVRHGTTSEHRRRVADHLLQASGKIRLGWGVER